MSKTRKRSILPIYKDEYSIAGLLTNNTLAYCSIVVPCNDNIKSIIINDGEFDVSHGEAKDLDLFPINSILVTTGWNRNDDIFTRDEVWAARTTPEDKPFNIGHDPHKIIGHITANYVVDDDLNVYDSFADLPEKFHILTAAVVYRHLNMDELEEEASKIIEDIQAQKKYVSMEALFTNFDYGLISSSGEHQIIRRCEKTAFLTKKLRIYKGDGEYNGCKIGRVLRNIVFSGKGLVDKPANPDSVIFNRVKVFACDYNVSIGEDFMSAELEKKIEQLTRELESANAKIRELDEEKVKSVIASKDSEIESLSEQLASAKKEAEKHKALAEELTSKVSDLEQNVEKVTKELEEAKSKLEESRIEAMKSERISTLVDCGVEKANAEEVVEKFINLDDEKFAEIVEMQKKILEASTATNTNTDDDDGSDDDGAATAGATDVEDVEEDEEPALASSDEDETAELLSAISSHFQNVLEK